MKTILIILSISFFLLSISFTANYVGVEKNLKSANRDLLASLLNVCDGYGFEIQLDKNVEYGQIYCSNGTRIGKNEDRQFGFSMGNSCQIKDLKFEFISLQLLPSVSCDFN